MNPGRNAPCPCGSGQRFKHCCGRPLPHTEPAAGLDASAIGTLVSMVHAGQLQQAEERANALLGLHPQAGILWKILSVALLRQGKQALEALRHAAELLPLDAEAHANLGSELRARADFAGALTSLRRSLDLEPDNADVLIDTGDAALALGQPQEAVPLYERALRLDMRRGEAHNNLANALLALGRAEEAAAHYRRALAIKPEDAQVLCNLGNVLRQLGQLEEALECTRRAIALAPGLSMAHNNLGLLHAGRGERSEAALCYREALRLKPGYVEALNNLANLLREQGKPREAASYCRQALELDPARADSHCNLGYVSLDLGRLSEAAESFRSALARQPQHVPARLGLTAVLRLQKRTAEAEANCQAALAAEPQSCTALMLLGELRSDLGRIEEALALFERAIALDAHFVPAYASIAAHRRMTRRDDAWLQRARQLLDRPLPLAEQIQLRYALGKYFDDVGEWHQAFISFQAANELTKRYGRSYDRAGFSGMIDRLMEVCSAGFTREPHPGLSESDRPVFIVGMPRSGTSLAEQILASHPQVFGAGEVRFWNRAFARLERAAGTSTARTAALAGIGDDYLMRVGPPAGTAARITDKMPANFLYAGLIHAAFPRARIIHMHRHPLDTCLSVYFQNFFNVSPYANDLGALAHYYGQYLRIMAHWRAILPPSTLLEVPYEGLIEETEGWARRMVDFIGLSWDAKCLDFQRTDRAIITASKWQVRQPINAGSIGRWRNYQQYLAPLLHLADAKARRSADARG